MQNGKSDDIFSALVVSDFPPTTSSNYEDLLVEYLMVYVPEEQELMLEESKDLHNGCLKSESSTSDSDSGRGSCDSHTLLMDKCGEAKEEERKTDRGQAQKGWEEEVSTFSHGDTVSPDMSSGRVKTWPSVFSPLPQYSSNPLDKESSLKMAKQHSLSTSSYLTQPGHTTKEAPGYWDKQPHLLHPQTQVRQQLQAHSDVNISSVGRKQAPAGLRSPSLRATEYVEVQRVNEEDMVLLQPVALGYGHQGEDYSKVKGVDCDNVLLLTQPEVKGEDRWKEEQENCYTSSTVGTMQKPAVCIHMPVQDEMALAGNGYVDTAAMCALPTC